MPFGFAGAALTGLALGAAGGAVISGIEGGNPLKGAEEGGLTGLGVAAGGEFGAASGIGSIAGGAIGGAAGGALGGEVTGGSPLSGAIGGALTGGITGATVGSASPGAGPSAIGGAPPPGAGPVDFTTIGSAAPGASAVASLPGAADFGTLPSPITGGGVQTFTADQVAQGLGTGGAAGGASSGGILGTVETAFNKNPVGAGLAGAGLLYNLVTGGQNSGTIGEIKGEAQGLSAQGNQLAGYLNSGTLPPTIQASLTSATNSAIAKVKSYYAANGMSGSSSELSAIQQVQMAAVEQTATIGEQLLTQGINEADISAQLLQGVAGVDEKQTAATGSAIASLAAALSGGRGGVSAGGLNINLGGT